MSIDNDMHFRRAFRSNPAARWDLRVTFGDNFTFAAVEPAAKLAGYVVEALSAPQAQQAIGDLSKSMHAIKTKAAAAIEVALGGVTVCRFELTLEAPHASIETLGKLAHDALNSAQPTLVLSAFGEGTQIRPKPLPAQIAAQLPNAWLSPRNRG